MNTFPRRMNTSQKIFHTPSTGNESSEPTVGIFREYLFVFGGGNSQVGYPQKTRTVFVISWDAMGSPSQNAGSSSGQDDMTWVDICFVHILRGSLNYVPILGRKSNLMLKSMVILRDLTPKKRALFGARCHFFDPWSCGPNHGRFLGPMIR